MKKKMFNFMMTMIILAIAFVSIAQFINMRNILTNYETINLSKMMAKISSVLKINNDYKQLNELVKYINTEDYNILVFNDSTRKIIYSLDKNFNRNFDKKMNFGDFDEAVATDISKKPYMLVVSKKIKNDEYLILISYMDKMDKALNSSIKNMQFFLIVFLILIILVLHMFLKTMFAEKNIDTENEDS